MVNFIVITFGGGVCLRVWKTYQVNYLHILQIDHKHVVAFIEFWKVASFCLVIILTVLFVFFN